MHLTDTAETMKYPTKTLRSYVDKHGDTEWVETKFNASLNPIATISDIIIGTIAQNAQPTPPSPFSMLLKWEIILVATAIVLYDEANDFSGQNSNIETGGGGLQVNFP